MIDSITHFDWLLTWPHLDAGIFCLRPPGSKLGPPCQKRCAFNIHGRTRLRSGQSRVRSLFSGMYHHFITLYRHHYLELVDMFAQFPYNTSLRYAHWVLSCIDDLIMFTYIYIYSFQNCVLSIPPRCKIQHPPPPPPQFQGCVISSWIEVSLLILIYSFGYADCAPYYMNLIYTCAVVGHYKESKKLNCPTIPATNNFQNVICIRSWRSKDFINVFCNRTASICMYIDHPNKTYKCMWVLNYLRVYDH